MSLFTRILMFYCIFAIGEYALGIDTPANILLSPDNTSENGYKTFMSNFANIGSDFWKLVGIAAITASIIGAGAFGGTSLGFILPLGIFSLFAAFFLTFITFPSSLFNSTGIPAEVNDLFKLFYCALNILFVYSLISWLKGNE